MAAINSVRVSSPTAVQERRSRKTYQAPEPDQRIYGVFGPQYAASLGQSTGAAGADILNQAALRMEAAKERGSYEDQLRAAQELQLVLASMEDKGATRDTIIENLPGYTDRGMGEVLTGLNGYEGLFAEPTASTGIIRRADNAQLNDLEATRLKGIAEVADRLSGTEYAPEAGWIEKALVHPAADPAAPYGVGVPVAPGANLKLEQYKADEGLTAEEQLALKIAGSEDEDGIEEPEVTIEIPSDTVDGKITRRRVLKGTPSELRAMGYDPDTGQRLNPNAGADGGDAPATPAAKPKTSSKVDMNQAKEFGSRYGTVTSTYRSPKDNKRVKGAKNSYHLSNRAIDIARRKGVTHKEVENGYRSKGYKIIESLDEGDHSHLAFSGGPVGDSTNIQIYATRLKASPHASDVKIVDDKILVTTKGGKQLVFDSKGKRIG